MAREQIAVIGAGSWGTAIAKLLSDHGNSVTMWAHRPEHVAAIDKDRENKEYLPGFILSDSLSVTADIKAAVSNAKLIVMVVPSHVYRSVFSELAPYLAKDSYVISAAKGIENDTQMTMNQVMRDVLANQSGIPAASAVQ